jgi:cytochrome c peroxidase
MSALVLVPLSLAGIAGVVVGCGRPPTEAQAQAGQSVEDVLGPVPVPRGNPQTPEKVELGRLLFFDPRLSSGNQTSCASCHEPAKGMSDGLPRSIGPKGEVGRNSTSMWNIAFEDFPSWDGSLASLEQHSLRALTGLAQNIPDLIAELDAVPEYHRRFQQVFGRNPTATDIIRALSAFERSLLSFRSPYGRFQAGDRS